MVIGRMDCCERDRDKRRGRRKRRGDRLGGVEGKGGGGGTLLSQS